MSVVIPKDKILVGIRREDKNYWERRVTIIPKHAQEIMKNHPNIQFIVQPSDRRIFSDSEYEQVGCIIYEDMNPCSLILGVKEIPIPKLLAHKTYMFFSHTIKAQSENMSTLDHMLSSKIRMLDYEKITNDKGARLVAFGRFAGIAGAIDYLAGMGQYLLQSGLSTPFLRISPSYKYFDLAQAYSHIKNVGKLIQQTQLPEELCPMVFAITGKGRCSLGAYEVLENLPIINVKPEELEGICANKSDPRHRTHVYVCYIESQHMVAHAQTGIFDKKDYYKNPQNYKPIFVEKYLPYISSIFHNMYWDQRFPRMISCEELRNSFRAGHKKLIGIGDVTCDFEGSVEFLRKFTTPDEPYWVYNPETEEVVDGINYRPNCILYQSLDFLPCELATDASTHFSTILKDWIPNIASSNIDDPYEKQTLLPHVRNAMVTLNGKLTPDFEYITTLRADKEKENAEIQQESESQTMASNKFNYFVKIKLQGPFFANKAINTILDTCQENNIYFTASKLIPGSKDDDTSTMELLLHTQNNVVLQETLEKIQELGAKFNISIVDSAIPPRDKGKVLLPRL